MYWKKTALPAVLGISLILSGCSCGKDKPEEDSQKTVSSTVAVKKSEASSQVSSKTATAEQEKKARLDQIRTLGAETIVDTTGFTPEEVRSCFYSSPLTPEMVSQIDGDMYDSNNTFMTADQFRLVRVLYFGFDGTSKVGELICNELIAEDLENVFHELYTAAYPIDRVCLPHGYGMDDERVTTDDITRCLATVWDENGQTAPNEHSLGLAIDINSLYNPQVIVEEDGTTTCLPEAGRPYEDRTNGGPHFIDQNDLAYQVFTKYGFNWGGVWQGRNDYQHFEKYFNHDTRQVDQSIHS